VCLYKLLDGRPFDECWQPPEDDGFDSIPVPDLGEALSVFGQRPPKVCGWVGMVRDLTEIHLDHFTTTQASAVLADAVRHIKREHRTGTGRVDTSSVPSGDALWSFGIREHAELVRRIVGQASGGSRLQLSHVRKMAKRGVPPVSIDLADRVRLPLPRPSTSSRTWRRSCACSRRARSTTNWPRCKWMRRLGSGDQARIDDAWDAALQLLVRSDDENISLAYPAGYHGGQEISRFDVQIGRNRIFQADEMDLRFLREAMEDHVTREASCRC
jgi:uncharacterized protein (TIGR04141 family)